MSEQVVKRYDLEGNLCTVSGDPLPKGVVAEEDYDALHAEAEALQRQVTELTNQRDAILLQARCWAGEAKTQQVITKAVGEALGGVPNWGPIAAGVEALRAENGRLLLENDGHNQRRIRNQAETKRLRTELEAARGLLRDAIDEIDYMSGASHACKGVDRSAAEAFITATPEPEARQDESLDDRLKQAGMLSVAELLKGAPLDAFINHVGVHDLASLLQWAEMRRGECLRMMARYDLGEKDKVDDLYEWTVAHCAAFTELHVNLRAALAEQGERQEAWANFDEMDLCMHKPSSGKWVKVYTTPQPGLDVSALRRIATGELKHAYNGLCPDAVEGFDSRDPDCPACRALEGEPGPDVRGLVEALEGVVKRCSRSGYVGVDGQYLKVINAALAAHRQAQQGDSHDT